MKKPMKKMPMATKAKGKATKDSGKVKMGAMRGGSPGAMAPSGSGRGGPESIPASFGGGRVSNKGKK